MYYVTAELIPSYEPSGEEAAMFDTVRAASQQFTPTWDPRSASYAPMALIAALALPSRLHQPVQFTE
jgi:hypothetical protein